MVNKINHVKNIEMKKEKLNMSFLVKRQILILIAIIFTLISCKTVPETNLDELKEPEYTYTIEKELNFPEFSEEEGPEKYVFIRLYNIDYLNPFYIANILKGGINAVEVNDMEAHHSAINVTLNDDFYGLTSGGKYKLGRESCMDTKSNKFMKHCNPEKSRQTTYAIKVHEDEYNNTKKFLEEYEINPNLKYDVGLNLKITSFAVRRRFFTKKENRTVENIRYPKIKAHKAQDQDYKEQNFVCSTFVAYVLEKNVDSIKNFFKENNINYDYVMVSDLAVLPGVVQLFSSGFLEYDLAATEFIIIHPEFQEYLYDDKKNINNISPETNSDKPFPAP